MSLTKSELKKLIQEVAQNEGFLDRMFAEPEDPTDLDKAVNMLKKDHKMQISDSHPLYKILSNADPGDLQSLVSRLEQPYGAGVKVAKLQEDLGPETMNVIQGFMQIIDNFGIAAYPVILASAYAVGKEVYDAVKQKIDEKDPRGIMKNPEHRAEWNQ